MDIPESRQEERVPDSGSNSDSGQDGQGSQDSGGSTKDPSSEQPMKAQWVHDHEISFKKVVPLFLNLKDVLEKTISAEKSKLNSMISTKNSLRK